MLPFEDAAFIAQAGDIVGPVLSRFGYHIIKVNDRRNENETEEINASHILLKIEMAWDRNDSGYSKPQWYFSLGPDW